jgi:hypothetical protein
MKREQLLSAIRKWCRKNDTDFAANTIAGKGSHVKVYVGTDRWTVVKSGELSSLYVDMVLKQLGIPRNAIKR